MIALILGGGGHAQVVADILLRMGEKGTAVTIAGYLDDNPKLIGQRILGLPVLGTIADLAVFPHDVILAAIGDNRTRRQLFERWQQQGEHFIIARHPHSVIAPDVPVGPGTMICPGVVINTGSEIGANIILNTGCTVDHHNLIGNHAHIAPGVHLGGEVKIGEGALVGIGATIMPRRTVGEWAVVGAGALVSKDIPPFSVAEGVPAQIVNHLAAIK